MMRLTLAWQLSEWCSANRLSLNFNKTCYSIFGNKQKITDELKLYICGNEIQNTHSCKYLEIFVDSDLKWDIHINSVYNKLLKFLSIFYKIRTKIPEDILRMIYFAFVHSQLLYGIEVYANTTSNQLATLTALNNKLLRILQRKPTRSHTVELYKIYYTLPVRLLHNFQILIFMHKYVYHRLELLSVFSENFELDKLIHQHDTRQKEHFHTDSIQSEIGKKLSNSKVVCYGTIYLQTLRQPNHSPCSNVNLKCAYYSLWNIRNNVVQHLRFLLYLHLCLVSYCCVFLHNTMKLHKYINYIHTCVCMYSS